MIPALTSRPALLKSPPNPPVYPLSYPDAVRPLFFGRQLLGLPYVAHTLEDNPGEQQLIVNLRELDCTTLTENIVALTLCAKAEIYTFAAFLESLETIRYFKNQTFEGYPARLHYFCS